MQRTLFPHAKKKLLATVNSFKLAKKLGKKMSTYRRVWFIPKLAVFPWRRPAKVPPSSPPFTVVHHRVQEDIHESAAVISAMDNRSTNDPSECVRTVVPLREQNVWLFM